VPRYIQVLQNCVKHKVQDYILQNTHFNDLTLLLIRLDILKVKEAIAMEVAQKARGKKQSNVRNISGSNAIKFLKGG
jgi:hypothetical protein